MADRLVAIDRGEEPEPLYRVTFQDETDLQRLLSPQTIGLLRTIACESPESIRELARLVDRDIWKVHDNLQKLETCGLVDFELGLDPLVIRSSTTWRCSTCFV